MSGDIHFQVMNNGCMEWIEMKIESMYILMNLHLLLFHINITVFFNNSPSFVTFPFNILLCIMITNQICVGVLEERGVEKKCCDGV